MYEYNATVTKVVDADTLHVVVDLGMDIFTKKTIRLAQIDAAERNTQEGMAAKAFVESLLPMGKQVLLRTIKDKREKYGRYLAVVIVDGANLNAALVTAGHAVYTLP